MERLSAIAIAAGALGLLLELTGGLGTHTGLLHFRTGLRTFFIGGQVGMYVAIASVALLLLSWRVRGLKRKQLALALALGLFAFTPLYLFKEKAGSVPPIHDITTDTQDPPAFVAITPALRGEGANTLEYGGSELAAQQNLSYGDLKSLELALGKDECHAKAAQAVQTMGWELVDSDPAQGRIEATDTTLFFGFKDDVVVRLRQAEDGKCRVDVRSVSRVGKSDVGANAERIRRYLALLRQTA